jgi:hypothetical protein
LLSLLLKLKLSCYYFIIRCDIKSSIFASIVEEARAKDSKLGNPSVLALTLGNSMPCCLITVSKEEPEKAAPKPKQVRKKENQEN